MAIVLLIKTEDGNVTELPILSKVTMGRSGNNDYKIADAKMSGNHCTFEVTAKGQVLFTDLGSSNGSFLNNSQIMNTMVRVHDVVRIGNTLIKIEDKKLSPSERLAIGVSIIKNKKDKTLPELSIKAPKSNNDAHASDRDNNSDGNDVKKNTVMLNQAHKAKKKPAVNNWGGAENVIDQEASSGQTKFLKLVRNQPKIKKKK